MREIPACFRSSADRMTRLFGRAGVSPDALTFASLAAAGGAGVAFAFGWIVVAGVLVWLSGLFDLFDGRLARSSGTASRRGALLDSVCDRGGELLLFSGLALHFERGAALAVVLAASGGSFLVSYTRARAEALGAELRGVGLLQRAERILVLGAAAIVTPLVGEWLLVAALTALALLGLATAIQRVRRAYASLGSLPQTLRSAIDAAPHVLRNDASH